MTLVKSSLFNRSIFKVGKLHILIIKITLLYAVFKYKNNNNFLFTGESVEVLLEYSTKLLERFWYSWEMLPLMYVILKDARADLEEATRRIAEGKDFYIFIE